LERFISCLTSSIFTYILLMSYDRIDLFSFLYFEVIFLTPYHILEPTILTHYDLNIHHLSDT
jgi:hypothetical protein